MDEIINKIYESLTNFIDDLEETKTKLVIKIQVRKCLNYMNREDFPQELIEPLAEAMALECLEESEKELKRVTVGDTSVEYNTSTSVSDKVAVSMREQLNKFRRVGTIGIIKSREEK